MKSLFRWQYHPQCTNKRIAIIVLLLLGGFTAIVLRLFLLSFVYKSNNYMVSANGDCCIRREITDRNGDLLAINLPTASIFAHPKQISDPEGVAYQLTKAIPDLEYTQVVEKLKRNKNFVWLRRDVNPEEQKIIKNLGIKGIESIKDYKRFYTYSSILSHAIGYVDRDGKGLAGLERGLEPILKDTNLKDQKIALSIDMNIQSIVSEELKSARQQYSAKAGCALVADVTTGEILAFVNEPNFNPHKIDPTNIESLENRNALCSYQLGSIFKPIVVAIGLDMGKVDLCDLYDVTELQIGKQKFEDLTHSSGWYTVAKILAKSSNKGISKIALEIGQDTVRQYCKLLGFFDTVPHIEIPEKAKPIYHRQNWSNLDLINTSYGYGICLTPLHYVQAMIALINGGNLIPLTLLKADYPPKGVQVLHNESTSEKMQILLRLVVRHGTCRGAYVAGQDVGAKTGTANKLIDGRYDKKRVFCSIVAAFPINKPKYIIYAMLDEPQTPPGAKTATAGLTMPPIIKQIIMRMSTKYALEPQKDDYSKWDYLLNPPETNSISEEKNSTTHSLQ
jgi:cell division protein FtsI (penicillin-binding protein 3)